MVEYPVNLLKVLDEYNLTIGDYLELLDLLTPKEDELTDVIVQRFTAGEFRLLIKEACRMINKRHKLPNKFKRYL